MIPDPSLWQCHYAVIGWPVAHSLSPQLQNAAFEYYRLGAPYGKCAVPPEELNDFAANARTRLAGFNVTVPHKRQIIAALDEITPEAETVQSVNTVSVRSGRLYGDSTDGYGLAMALQDAFALPVAGHAFCFLGAGGAAQAAAGYFATHRAKELFIVNRSIARAADLAERLNGLCPSCRCHAVAASDLPAVRRAVAAAEVVIQATSLGVRPDDPPPLSETVLAEAKRCFDTIYHPTAFQRAAAGRGIPVADGRGMLLHQGARSFELWTGKPAPVEAMRAALEEAIRRNRQ